MQGLVRVVVLILAPSFATCVPASTHDVSKPPVMAGGIASFEVLDRNADRRLSRSEAGFDRLLAAIFADSDVDGDGYLTPTEFARATGSAPINL